MASADLWLDFDQIRHNVKNNTVERLKQILTGFNDECGTHISKSGKKQEIIDRVVAQLDYWRTHNMEDKWAKAKAIIYQVRNANIYTPNRISSTVISTPVAPQTAYAANRSAYLTGISASTSMGRYDPYAPPRKPAQVTVPVASSSSSPSRPLGIRFKESPFYHVEQAVSSVTECPESSSATDRRQQSFSFTLSAEHINKLKAPNSRYQLRLFCTSSVFYSGSASFRTGVPCPIEFPPTCEVRVNGAQLTANLKGLKKKPGTAPPPDLGKYTRLIGVPNRVDMVYVNSQQPAQPKKYYLVVMLVETTTVQQLVSELVATKHQSSEDVRKRMVGSSSEDDDIVAGPQTLSLKCPLSFVRIVTPSRSSKCVHSQCFDATSWFTVMEQTTTWLCPVCERILDPKELIIDGYTDEILKATPDTVEDVIVEADGQWHTSDNKYGSAGWKASHPSSLQSATVSKPAKSPARSLPKPANAEPDKKDKAHEILVLDSDDEDESQVKRELSPSSSALSVYQSQGSANSVPRTQSQVGGVIDLTLDSEDEEVRPTRKVGKRKASDAGLPSISPTEQVWKKGRAETGPSVHTESGAPTGNYRTTYTDTVHDSMPTSPHRFASYTVPGLTRDVDTFGRGTSSTAASGLPVLPSINTMLSRSNERWS